jgi:hypothetical protein
MEKEEEKKAADANTANATRIYATTIAKIRGIYVRQATTNTRRELPTNV